MKITVITLFPELYPPFLAHSMIKKAIKKGFLEVEIVNLRSFSSEPHHQVDDYGYGGGPGMVLKVDVVYKALQATASANSKIILLSPQGKLWKQNLAQNYSTNPSYQHLVLIAGHYEGVDERIRFYIDEEISIGDYILTGGELPSMVLIDSIARLIPGVINEASILCESFDNLLLDHAVYTRPVQFQEHAVPSVLVSGHHAKIKEWRLLNQQTRTKNKRPDLWKKYQLQKNKNNK